MPVTNSPVTESNNIGGSVRCFFHADDYGLTPAITKDILECIDAGRLQSTSVMANAAYAETAMEALKIRPHINVAVHLNILEGKALSVAGHIPGLTDAHGMFSGSIPTLCAKLIHCRKKSAHGLLGAIETELRAQIDKVASALPGKPLHIDGHLHIHAIPPLRGILASILRSYPVAYVRTPRDIRCVLPGSFALQLMGTARRELLIMWSRTLRPLLQQYGANSSQFFISAFASGHLNLQRLKASLQSIVPLARENDLVEIMLHPGTQGSGDANDPFGRDVRFRTFYSDPNRAMEKALLLSEDLPALLEQCAARMCHPLAKL